MGVFKFAVIMHPFNINEVNKKFIVMRGLPKTWQEKIVRKIPPFKISCIKGTSDKGKIEGYFIYLGLTSEDFLNLPEQYCLNRILKCGKLAEKFGAQLIGLGGTTSIIGNGGVDVARCLNTAVTTGKTYKIASVFKSAESILGGNGKNKEDTDCVIIGANSPVGNVCTHILTRKGFRYLTLIAPDKRRLNNIAKKILFDYGISVKITSNISKALAAADLIIQAGSLGDVNKIKVVYKPGVIICNLFHPYKEGVNQGLISGGRDSVLVESGVIQVPEKINFIHNSGYPPQTTCPEVAEAMVLALENRKHNYSLGENMRIEKVNEIIRLAQTHGFVQTGFYSRGKIVSF